MIMKQCAKCLLSDNIPSVRVDKDGLCNYCASSNEKHAGPKETDGLFESLLEKYKNSKYQVTMAFSGGKDSTYTLKLLKEKYDARILAVTFNNGFISDTCLRNINKVTDYLGVDSLIIKYPVPKIINAFRFVRDREVFPRVSLERASSICNLCIAFIKHRIYYESIIRDIPIICFGWTPGQVETVKPLIKLSYLTVSKVFDNVRNAIVGELGQTYDRYFLGADFLKKNEDRIPYLYYPFVENSYNEGLITEEIKKIGWEPPENTDGNSSNCLLNSYANQCHMERYGYHPYAFEISNMVRAGFMTREEGAVKLENVKNDMTYESVKNIFEGV